MRMPTRKMRPPAQTKNAVAASVSTKPRAICQAGGASLVPFATPVLMTLRLALTPAPPAWQIALGFGLTLAATAFFVWAGGRIFRVGILMQGKSATFAEMWRWVRAG